MDSSHSQGSNCSSHIPGEMFKIVAVEDVIDAHAHLDLFQGFPGHGDVGSFKPRCSAPIIEADRVSEIGIDTILFHHHTPRQREGECSLLEYCTESAI